LITSVRLAGRLRFVVLEDDDTSSAAAALRLEDVQDIRGLLACSSVREVGNGWSWTAMAWTIYMHFF
jgi:hypothetical protein